MIKSQNNEHLNLSKEYILAFSGGGTKALYGLAWTQAMLERGLKISEIFASSSGAAFGLSIVSGNAPQVAEDFFDRAQRHKHLDLMGFLRGGALSGFEQTNAQMVKKWASLESLKSNKMPISILALKIPDQSRRLRVWSFYNLARLLGKDISQGTQRAKFYARKIGVEPVLFRGTDFQNQQEIVDAVLASSSLPPFVGRGKRFKQWLDGGLIHPSPVCEALKKNPKAEVIAICYHPKTARYIENSLKADGLDTQKVHWVYPKKRMSVGVLKFKSVESLRECYQDGYAHGFNQELISVSDS